MFNVKDKKLIPYQALLFGALGLYLWRLNKLNTMGEGKTKLSIDTDKISRVATPFLPGITPEKAPEVQRGIKNTLDVLFERIKK